MVATFLQGELSSERFGPAVRDQLAAMAQPDELLTRPDLADPQASKARGVVLAATRGYGEDREVFEFFPACVLWVRALLAPDELARVRYIEYSYWNEISGGSRLPADAARRIKAGIEAFGVPNDRSIDPHAGDHPERGEHQDDLRALAGGLASEELSDPGSVSDELLGEVLALLLNRGAPTDPAG